MPVYHKLGEVEPVSSQSPVSQGHVALDIKRKTNKDSDIPRGARPDFDSPVGELVLNPSILQNLKFLTWKIMLLESIISAHIL